MRFRPPYARLCLRAVRQQMDVAWLEFEPCLRERIQACNLFDPEQVLVGRSAARPRLERRAQRLLVSVDQAFLQIAGRGCVRKQHSRLIWPGQRIRLRSRRECDA